MSSFPQLTGTVDDRDTIIEGLRSQNRKLDEALRLERNKSAQSEAGVKELRRVLTPLHRALQVIFGEIDAMGLSDAPAQAPQNGVKSAAWEMWKQKLGGIPARFIEALLIGGSMNQTQLRIAVGCAQGSVAGAVCVLNKAGLINKNGGMISLKQL